MYKADYHTHTEFSFDSTEPMENQVKKAISLGFDEMVITDHHESDPTNEEYFFETDIDAYIKHFNTIKQKYKNQINLKLGAEIGYEARGRDILNKFVNDHPFEFVICSLHSLEGSDFYLPDFFVDKTKEESYSQYFITIQAFLKDFQNFEVLGHIDFIRRYGNYENTELKYLDYKELIDNILKDLIYNGKGIEINTSGIRYGIGEMHPGYDIVKRYRQLGGEIITIGSDAHRSEDMGANYDHARAILKEAGFKYFTTFTDRKPTFRKL